MPDAYYNLFSQAKLFYSPYPPIIFFVTPELGIKIRRAQNGWGKKVATLNAPLMLSLDRRAEMVSEDEDRGDKSTGDNFSDDSERSYRLGDSTRVA